MRTTPTMARRPRQTFLLSAVVLGTGFVPTSPRFYTIAGERIVDESNFRSCGQVVGVLHPTLPFSWSSSAGLAFVWRHTRASSEATLQLVRLKVHAFADLFDNPRQSNLFRRRRPG